MFGCEKASFKKYVSPTFSYYKSIDYKSLLLFLYLAIGGECNFLDLISSVLWLGSIKLKKIGPGLRQKIFIDTQKRTDLSGSLRKILRSLHY